MFDTLLDKSLRVSYVGRIEKKAYEYFVASGVAKSVDAAWLVQDKVTSLNIDDEMRDMENAAILDFLNFEAMD